MPGAPQLDLRRQPAECSLFRHLDLPPDVFSASDERLLAVSRSRKQTHAMVVPVAVRFAWHAHWVELCLGGMLL